MKERSKSTDRELLELAAKAAGIKKGIGGAFWTKDAGIFDPINDDADAFRLLVFLANNYEDFHSVIWSWTHREIRVFAGGHEGFGEDEYAKLRYAIVNAAAEYGRKLK